MRDSIEPAGLRGLNAILHLINTSNRAMYQRIIPHEHFKDPYISQDELLQDFDRMLFYVYKSEHRIVGVVALEIETTDVGTIQRCYVLPSYQRQGIGTALMRHVERIAQSVGLRQLKLHVGASACWAVSFYQKLGYDTIERLEQAWGITLVMTKQLYEPYIRRQDEYTVLMHIEFSGTIWFWRGPAPWYFVTMPAEQSQELKAISGFVTYGWGVIPVHVRIGNTEWETSLFPKDGRYLVPIKASVRSAENLEEGDTVRIQLDVG